MALWALQYAGWLPFAAVRGFAWHGHEMLFGYTMAVVAGFLFTAVRNWTQKATPTGASLAAIVVLWLAGRALVLTPFALAAAVVNALFPLAVAVGIGVPLLASGNRRNYFFVALLVAMSAAVLLFHLSAAGGVAWPAVASLRVGLGVVLFVVAVIGGRVIPMFTNNGVPGAGATRKPGLEKASLAALLVLPVADLLRLDGPPLAVLCLAGAALHAARLWLWHPARTLRTPLVWSLHAAYAWIVVHLVWRAAAAAGLVPEPLATHALTVGVIGGMTLAMMTRTARGHTGLPLRAGAPEVACYVLVNLAAIVRVFGGLAPGGLYASTIAASALLWSAAFAVYFVRYWPILTAPRVDGAPG